MATVYILLRMISNISSTGGHYNSSNIILHHTKPVKLKVVITVVAVLSFRVFHLLLTKHVGGRLLQLVRVIFLTKRLGHIFLTGNLLCGRVFGDLVSLVCL